MQFSSWIILGISDWFLQIRAKCEPLEQENGTRKVKMRIAGMDFWVCDRKVTPWGRPPVCRFEGSPP